MAWNETAVTEKGLELLEKCIFGGSIEITSAVGGERTSDKDKLAQLTNILLPRREMEVVGAKPLSYGAEVSVRLHNINLRTGYRLKQIGLFGRIKDSGEAPVLLAVIQDNEGEEIPSEADNPEYLLECDFLIPISGEADITAVLSSRSFATLEDLKNHSHPPMTGASEYLDGKSGFVPQPSAGEQEKFLRADGTWQYVPKVHPFAVRARDKSKTDYGYKPGGRFRLMIDASDFTGTAEIAIVREDNTLLDANNMTRYAQTAKGGDFIVKGE